MNPQWHLLPDFDDDQFADMSGPNSRDEALLDPSGSSSSNNSNTPTFNVPAIRTEQSDNDDTDATGGPSFSLHSPPATGTTTETKPKGKRVGFTTSSNESPSANDRLNPRGAYGPAGGASSNPTSGATTPRSGYASPTPNGLDRPPAPEELVNAVHKAFGQPLPQKPKPAIRKAPSLKLESGAIEESDEEDTRAKRSRNEARDRANRLAMSVGSASAPSSRRNSFELKNEKRASTADDIPMHQLQPLRRQTHHGGLDGINSEDDEEEEKRKPVDNGTLEEAKKLVRSHTIRERRNGQMLAPSQDLISRPATPTMEKNMDDYVAEPDKYRGGIFGALLNLYSAQNQGHHQWGGHSRNNSGGTSGTASPTLGGTPYTMTPTTSPPASGTTTPTLGSGGQKSRRSWYLGGHGGHHHPHGHHQQAKESQSSLAQLVGSSAMLAAPSAQGGFDDLKSAPRPGMGKRTRSGGAISTAMHKLGKPRLADEIRITVHISQVMARQRYLLKLCRALMLFGAPTHRLEDCMKMSARVLEIESQFLYIPGCMIISFDDSTTHTTEVKLVRVSQGVELGKLRDTHACYKDVVHDRIGVEEATQRLEEILKRPTKFKPWTLVPVYGLASACVGPFAFEARLIDLPIAFFLGCTVGYLQLIAAAQSNLFNNVFEISAAVLTSFFARAFGSIQGGKLFCFSALAQSSIALILPGYIVLCASSELQSKHLVAGSVRMVYAIIYSLFLGFGMTIGIVLYGVMDHKATSNTTCTDQMPMGYTFFFVPAFTICLCIINQAKWKQMPIMVTISFLGYLVNKFSSQRFENNTQISSTLGALAIGAMANLYSRLGTKADNFFLDLYENHLRPRWRHLRRRTLGKKAAAKEKTRSIMSAFPNKRVDDDDSDDMSPPASSAASAIYTPRARKVGYGVAAAAMLPAIFVQVPSGLAVSGSLVSGITSADQIVHNGTSSGGVTTVASGSDSSTLNSAAFSVGYSVIQVAIGITVGLFLSALVIYPFGKRRSGLFSF
ncbi:hypothetical protein BKA80DRAFT_320260 [Phyllosticta citrichinensis]